MARDATARLYGVDENTLKFKKLRLTKRYDEGTITFRARKDNLVFLDKLHESVWATRLSGGTRSGVVCLEVNAIGRAVKNGDETVLKIDGTDREFVLVDDVKAKPREPKASDLAELQKAMAGGESSYTVTGYVEGWSGRWPDVLGKRPTQRPRLMVTGFEVSGE